MMRSRHLETPQMRWAGARMDDRDIYISYSYISVRYILFCYYQNIFDAYFRQTYSVASLKHCSKLELILKS